MTASARRPVVRISRSVRTGLVVGFVTAVVTLAAVAIMPSPATVDSQSTGDPAVADTVRDLAGNGYRGLSVALISGGIVRYAGVGLSDGSNGRPVDETTAYELGSIGKGMTGMLLADSGLDPETPVTDLLPDVEFSDESVASATLAELASHRSGLPGLRFTPASFAQNWLAQMITGADPYAGGTADAVLADAAAVSAGDKGDVSYSNLGMAVLGLALAERAGTSYPELLADRLLQPLDMNATLVARSDDDLPRNRAHGARANGRPAAPWHELGWGGAGGGVWSTSHDVAILIQELMDGTAPGADATTPRYDAGGGEEIGFGWFTEEVDGRYITWHNGATGGFSTWAGFDADAGIGVVVLGNTDRSVDAIGWRLLDVDKQLGRDWRSVIFLALTVIGSAFAGLIVVMNRRPDRLGVVRDASFGALILLAVWNTGTWQTVPPALWLVGVAALAATTANVALGWADLPAFGYGRRWF